MISYRFLSKKVLYISSCIILIYCIRIYFIDVLDIYPALQKRDDIIGFSAAGRKDPLKKELIYLQMLFRHGHRAPFRLYSTDPNNGSLWMEGPGSLTKLGRLELYHMGYHLQKRYADFITTNPKEVDVVSADSTRTKYSAHSFMAGLYSPKDKFKFKEGLNWQPIVVKNSVAYKKILSRRRCLRASRQHRLLAQSKLANDTRKAFDKYYKYWAENSGDPVDDWKHANDLGKTLTIERRYNLSVPDWAYTHKRELDIQTGSLIGFMIENMKTKIEGKDPEKKVFVYSGHGNFVVQYMFALGRYNWAEPPPASTIAVELWRDTDYKHWVRLLFFNSSNPEVDIGTPYTLNFDGCDKEFCPFSQFTERMNSFVPQNFESECKNISSIWEPLELICDLPTVSSANLQNFSQLLLSLIFLVLHNSRRRNVA